MYYRKKDPTHELLVEVQRRLPAGQRFVQEAFTTDHRRPVLMKLSELRSETFYFFEENTARAFRDAVIDLAAHDSGGRLLLTYQFAGEFKAHLHRLEHAANKLDKINVLVAGSVAKNKERLGQIDVRDISGSALTSYGIALKDGAHPLLFIYRDVRRVKYSENPRCLGFFSVDGDTVEDFAEDIELVVRNQATRLAAFDRLEMLHQTTQRVARELESYSRRMEMAVRRARRRPDLLTPARFQRIVGQAIAKMEQLKEIPRRALRSIDKPRK